MMAVIRNNILWTCHHVGVDGPGGSYASNDPLGLSVDRTAVQWFRLQTASTGDPLAYLSHRRIYDDCPVNPFWYYFPSLMVNSQGTMVIGFSGSREDTYVSAMFSWRLADGTEPPKPALLKSGVAPLLYRLGDYSYTTLDPTDGLTFWTIQEYVAGGESGAEPWGTWIGKIILTL